MIRTAKDITQNASFKTDVVIIGSGAGGAMLAWALSQKGVSVIMLEKGRHVLSSTFNQRELDMYETLYAGGARTGPSDLSSSILFGNVLGGSSVHYMANSFRLPEFKRKQWREQHGLDWIQDEVLDPNYDIIEQHLSVHSAMESELNENNKIIKRGLEKMGWRGEPARHARKACIGAGTCLIGCPFDRKMSQLVATVPDLVAKGVPIFTDTEVVKIVIRGGRAVGLEAKTRDPETGKQTASIRIDADHVVLAAGGVGSAVFWQKSGLPDTSGQVGKNFQVTPHLFVFGEFEHDVNGTYGTPCSWVSHQFEEQKGVEGGYMMQGIFAQPGMVGSMMPGFGREHRRMMRLFTKGAAVLSLIDDEEPGEVGVAGDGTPEIRYHLRGKDLPKARDFLKKATQVLLAAGAKRVIIPDVRITQIASEKELDKIDAVSLSPGQIPFVGTSCLGTLRMGKDPAKSVVGLNHETHAVKNLYVSDASWFPGSSAVDPSMTIMNGSLRLAGMLLNR